ncbi:hypothetical protein SteCoe_3710 [Stentor coeruleus]|uniref:DUSP domain-containing protein n=1 Tax=Stentor coeruleus TaxID=5963 RepID=A0A1R2CWI3_9CILI|nr:hypothetical protein SteCoe_3710 [Stentor coeruleus]
MDPEVQKEEIKSNEPFCLGELFKNNKVVCIIPLNWWNNWCNYVGYYSSPSNIHPGNIETHRELLSDKQNHAYITKISWQKLKQWYSVYEDLEVFIINGKPDLNPLEVSVLLENNQEQIFLLSLELTVREIKAYLCEKLNKDPQWHKISIKNFSGYIRKLKDPTTKLANLDILNCSLLLLKSNTLCADTSAPQEGVFHLSSVENGPNYRNANDNCDIEMTDMTRDTDKHIYADTPEYDPQDYEYKDIDIDVEGLSEVRDRVLLALQGDKLKLRIQKLKKLRQIMNNISQNFT